MTILRIILIFFASLEIAFNNKLIFDILIVPYFIILILLIFGMQDIFYIIDIFLTFNTAYYEFG